ncbi:hydroxypyruvate isomerase [Aliiroseovarius halocynthiae]|uniref:TIM barrel protein n=1 Tax=Aliiroseovarius halocynthiae TaxID=985055 RepID=A0A545SMA5_9RHOB|nr:TIM barrel protein [Aliiroseovarius halocynthiae]TQV66087.1 TIM barrel protein [Aliiroseovarius halocynthiae]SMR83201.1 hydroxypyruvate isomerase [Aliiroseovarius halocynthiae]
MPRFAANLTLLFTELPFLDRFEAAAEAGFDAVEVLFPYEDAAPEVQRRLAAFGLHMVLINTPPPNWTGGARGFAAIPDGQDRFRHDFKRALRFAHAFNATHLHIMAGVADGDAARSIFVENLTWAAAEAPKQSLTIEPINQGDMPGYFLSDYDLAADILGEVNAPNLGLQFDAYHAHKITGDMPATWKKVKHLTRHIQIGGLPDRHEPLAGVIDYPAWFQGLDDGGYDGWVSGEYHPAGRTEDGLSWIKGFD